MPYNKWHFNSTNITRSKLSQRLRGSKRQSRKINRQLRRSDCCHATISQILPIALLYSDWLSRGPKFFPNQHVKTFARIYFLSWTEMLYEDYPLFSRIKKSDKYFSYWIYFTWSIDRYVTFQNCEINLC